MEWSNDVIIEFLELYEAEPSIWNPKDPKHNNRTCISLAWERIQKNLSVTFSITDLKKKKDALMATYRKLTHKKVEQANNRTSGEYQKTEWFAYETMHRFLQGIYRPRISNTEVTRS